MLLPQHSMLILPSTVLLPQPSALSLRSAVLLPAQYTDPAQSSRRLYFTARMVQVSYAKRRAARLGKPLLVLLTRSGCGACQNLKQSFNRGQDAVALLDKFVVVHAQDEQQAQWQAPSHGSEHLILCRTCKQSLLTGSVIGTLHRLTSMRPVRRCRSRYTVPVTSRLISSTTSPLYCGG